MARLLSEYAHLVIPLEKGHSLNMVLRTFLKYGMQLDNKLL